VRSTSKFGGLAACLVLALYLFSAFSGLPQAASGASSQASTPPPVYVQIRGVGSYGNWYPQDQSPAGVIKMVEEFHKATGRPVDVLAVVEGPQVPTELIHNHAMTLNTFLRHLVEVGGGQVIPTLNMNYYTSGTGVTKQSYCDPHNPANCGPSWFWEVSTELLSLAAVKNGSRILFLEAYPQWFRNVGPTVVQTVLAGLEAQGWKQLIMKQGPSSQQPFPDFGYASYMDMTTSCKLTSPFCFESNKLISQEWVNDGSYLKGVLGMFDLQILNSPKHPTGLATFLSHLTTRQQAAGLRNLASSQSGINYFLVYPLIVGTARNGVTYYWDAKTAHRPTGATFISLEEMLATMY
jgi:hypothetical protein